MRHTHRTLHSGRLWQLSSTTKRILMLDFRPPYRHHSRRGSSSSSSIHHSRLPAILFVLVAASSSLRAVAAFSSRSHLLPPSAAAAIFGSSRGRTSRRSLPSSSSRLAVSIQAVGSISISSSTAENTDNSMTSPSSLSSTATSTIIPGLATPTLHNLVEYATSFSAANGLQVELRDSSSATTTTSSSSSSSTHRGYITAPISLLPQCYPASQFRIATLLAAPFNILVDKISVDGEFLKKTLQDVRNVDVYTGKLLELYEEIYLGEHSRGMEWGRHARHADKLGIQRSDYMLHKETTTSSRSNSDGAAAAAEIGGCYSLKQVELNTIASSFAGLASTVARMHRFLTQRLEGELQQFLGENERAVMGTDDDDYVGGSKNAILGASPSSSSMDDDCILGIAERGVPESPAMTRIPSAIAVAYDRYCTRFDTDSTADATTTTTATAQPTVLFVVQPKETNTVDQRLLEFALWNNHKIPVVRMSLAEIYDKVTLDEESGRLTFMDGSGDGGCSSKREVAVVYFRAGYAPTDYPSGYNTKDGTGVEWLARERLERGVATKCPCLGYHLAGTKKVQQELARPGVVEHFFPENDDGDSAAAARLIRTAFAGLYSLGADANDEDMKAVKEVLLHDGEGRYVLKPQREGGGYNFYGKQLADKLRSSCTITTDQDDVPTIQLSPALSEFILMERLFPPQQRAILLRNGRVEGSGMTISELGCFGTIVVSGEGDVVHNEYAGFLLRTKFSGVDEGGVASGFATLSSPYLC